MSEAMVEQTDFGSVFALLTATYGFDPDFIYNNLTWPQVRMYLENMPLVEYRKHLPTAKLTATMLNMMGGKPKDSKPSDMIPFHPHELMPQYALLEGMLEGISSGIRQESAEEFFRLSREGLLPGWVVATADIHLLRNVLGG